MSSPQASPFLLPTSTSVPFVSLTFSLSGDSRTSSTFVSHISHLIPNVEQVKGVATSVPISTIYRWISYRFVGRYVQQ
uniref:Uncharacterized protein n=1 Tax=Helianthus annuus TaxID=4232 RepID=A0A251U8X1_HELAN